MPRKPEASRPINHPDIGPQLRGLTTAALECVRTTLERKKGDRVAMDAAKWVLTEVAHGVEGKASRDEADDLGRTLRLMRGGKG